MYTWIKDPGCHTMIANGGIFAEVRKIEGGWWEAIAADLPMVCRTAKQGRAYCEGMLRTHTASRG